MNPIFVHFIPPSPAQPVARRDFIKATLAVGLAAAVLPVSAQTIQTSAAGLTTGVVQVPTGNGSIPAYFAMPENGQNLSVVLVAHEIFGVHEHIKDICRRLAKAGYYAIAPELFVRQGDVSTMQIFKTYKKT